MVVSAVGEHRFSIYRLHFKQIIIIFFKETVSELEERLAELHMLAPHERHEFYSASEEASSYSDTHSSAAEELPSAFHVYVKGMVSHPPSVYPVQMEHQG